MEVTMTYDEYTPESREKGKYSDAIKNFLKSDTKTLIFSCVNSEEAKRVSGAVRAYNKAHWLGLCIWTKNNKVFVIKG